MDEESGKAANAADGLRPPPPNGKGRVLRWLGIAIVALVVAGLAVAFILPRHAVITRSIDIAAPPADVWPIVADLRRFNEWSPWADLDPDAAFTFTGPTDGVGQTLNWESDDQRVGSGAMTVEALDPDTRVDIGVAFADAGTANSFVMLEPAGSGTRATWGFDSDLGFNPIARYFGMMADGVVGPDYEKGLARLKAVAEAPPQEAVADE